MGYAKRQLTAIIKNGETISGGVELSDTESPSALFLPDTLSGGSVGISARRGDGQIEPVRTSTLSETAGISITPDASGGGVVPLPFAELSGYDEIFITSDTTEGGDRTFYIPTRKI